MLHAKDLMTGGIILYEYQDKMFPARILEIYHKSLLVEEYNHEYEPVEIDQNKIFPITLTPEILEKNGFRYTGGGDGSMMLLTPFDEPGLRYNIYVGLKYKTINVYSAFPNELKNGRWRKHNSVDMEVSGPYVHELQHVLRLCGIDKEIEL